MTAVIPFVPSFCRENGEILQWYLKKAKKSQSPQILEIESICCLLTYIQTDAGLQKAKP